MKLRELRSRIDLTQKQLADAMGTTQQTVARWEAGKTVLNVDQIRDLCVVLQCTAEELLGWKSEESEARTSPFSIMGDELTFGTLHVCTRAIECAYPIGEKARSSLLSQMDDLAPLDDDNRCAWLHSWTLDNKLLLINPTAVRKLNLVSEDVEAMPDFHNAEVYRALEDWPSSAVTGKIRQLCDEIAGSSEQPENVWRLVSELCVIYKDGSHERSLLTEDLATEWFSVVTGLPDARQHSFVEVDREGSEVRTFANLSAISIVEIPANLFLRLTAD